jgi:glycosyltransferase involved in cell wall biosynthesis
MTTKGVMASQLKVAMLSNYLPSGSKIGVGYQVHALANGLVQRGHSVTVFSACAPSPGAAYETVQLSLPPRLRTFAFAWQARSLDLSSFDVVHAHGDDYWLGRGGPPHIRTLHGSCFEEALRVPGLREKARMAALGFSEIVATFVADHTVMVSPQTRRWTPWVRTVIPNGVSAELFGPRAGPHAAQPTILFVGTYRNRKRGRMLMEVFGREVLPRVPDARLVMVCEDAPPAPRVTVTGRISDQELAEWYRSAWVFCLPSTYEGFGIPYAEALTAGLPVVASDNPGARYVLGGSDAGVISSDARLGSTLIGFLQDESLRYRATIAALARAKDFSLTSVLDSYEHLYRTTAPRRPDSSSTAVTS